MPPRSVSDIIKVLDQYKQDPSATNAARELLAKPLQEDPDHRQMFRQHYARARAANAIGDYNAAIAELRKAREFMGNIGDRDVEPMLALGDLATYEISAGNPIRALEAVNQRMSIAYSQKNDGQIITTAINGIATYVALGDFDNARKTLARAEQAFADTRRNFSRYGLFRHYYAYYIERMRGQIFSAEGKYAEAESAFRKSLREQEEDTGDRAQRTRMKQGQEPEEVREANRGRLYRSLAQALLAQGRLNEAEMHLRTALKINLERVGRHAFDTIFDLASFSRILMEQGRLAESAMISEEAVKSAEGSGQVPFSRAVISAKRSLGAALVANGNWRDALSVFDAMRKGAETDPELARMLAAGDLDEAHALMKMQRAPAARELLRSILSRVVRQYGEQDARTSEVRGFYAVSLAKSGATNEALAEFARAVPVLVEEARNAAASDTGSVRRTRRLAFVLEAYIELLAQMQRAGTTVPGLDPVAESFRLADIARGSDVQRALSASAARANISDPALAELARREQDAQRRVASLSDILRSLLSAPPAQQLPSVIAQMRKDVETLTQERTVAKRDIERRFPEYAELVDPKPATIASVQVTLRAQETLISIYVGEDTTFVWALPRGGRATLASVPMGRGQVTKVVETLRKALEPQVASIDEIPQFDVATAAKLYEDLLKPVEGAWKGTSRHLFVVPHGPLGQLPFGLLPTSAATLAGAPLPFEDYKKVPWLIRDSALTQLPSVTALATLRHTPAARGERRMYLGIGDPYFSKEQAAQALQVAAAPTLIANAATGATTANRGMPVRLRSAAKTSGVDSAELALLPRLPDTADELMEIAKTLGADVARDLLLHKEANEKKVTSMNLTDRRIIHFATHGLVPGELNGLTQPALALTAPDVAGIDGDGLLTMDKILGLKLNADWVVLSACNTASGDGAGSEAVSGLGRAFFYAGARALLVSNWPVDSIAARVLMSDLFRRYATGPAQAKAESLRQAMLAMIDGPGFIAPDTGKPAYSYAHPLFWAPFVLVGD